MQVLPPVVLGITEGDLKEVAKRPAEFVDAQGWVEASAMLDKIAAAEEGGIIEVWGDGKAMRAYTYIDDLLDGILLLMHSDLEDGVNIGRQEYISVDGFVS